MKFSLRTAGILAVAALSLLAAVLAPQIIFGHLDAASGLLLANAVGLELKTLVEGIQTAFNAFKSTNDERLTALEVGGSVALGAEHWHLSLRFGGRLAAPGLLLPRCGGRAPPARNRRRPWSIAAQGRWSNDDTFTGGCHGIRHVLVAAPRHRAFGARAPRRRSLRPAPAQQRR